MIEEADCFLGVYSCSAFTLNLLERTDFLRGAYWEVPTVHVYRNDCRNSGM